MKKYRFIDTSADIFAHELAEATKEPCPPRFPTERGVITLKAIKTPRHITAPTTINVGGYHEMSSGEDTKVGLRLRRVISFTITPLASEHIKVIAESGSPAIMEHFIEWSNEYWPGETWHEVPSPTNTIAELEKSGVPKHRIKELTQYAIQEGVALEGIPAGHIRFFPDRIELVESEILQTEETMEALGTPTLQTPAEDGTGKRDDPLKIALSDKQTMRQYYKHYNIKTAKAIIEAVPKAWKRWSYEEEGRWGPGQIAKVYTLNATTIGRYLKALKAIGLTEIDGTPIP